MNNVIILGIILLVIAGIVASAGGLGILFFILALVLGIVFFRRNRDLKKNIYKMPEDALHITNVDKGGVFKLSGVEDKGTITLQVTAKHLYREGDFYWYELECDDGSGEKIWVEVEDDDETVVSITLQKMTIQDIGVTPSKLAKIDDEEKGTIIYKGRSYKYEDSDSAVFYRFCDDKKPEKLYYWDFVSGNDIISVEKWGEKEYQAFISQKMHPTQVTVLSNKEQGGV